MKSKKQKEKKIKPPKVKKEKVREKKKLSKKTTSFLLSWIVISVTFLTTYIIHHYVPAFSVHWIIFTMLFVCSPFSIYYLKCDLESDGKYNHEQISHANKVFIKLILNIWLWDIVYMTIFNHWLVAFFIFGVIGVIKFFYTLSGVFIERKEKNILVDILMILDFLAGIALAVYLIYLIPDKTVQTIVTTIVAAMFGGLLTLVGVAWTIRQGQKERAEDHRQLEEDRKQEEIKRAKPIFTFCMLYEEPKLENGKKYCISQGNFTDHYCCHISVEIENSDHAVFEMKRLHHDNMWTVLEGNTTILPNGKVVFDFQFNTFENIVLDTVDVLGNHYYYEIKVVFLKFSPSESKFYHTVREIKEISVEELQKRNIPLEDNNP